MARGPELEGRISGDSRGFIGASNKAQRSLGDLTKKGESTGAKMGKAFKGIAGGLKTIAKGAGVAGIALAAVGTAAVVSFAKFEKKFAQVTTLIDGQPKAIARLSKELRSLSVTMGVDVLEATEAAYQAISAGRTVAQDPAFLEAAFKAAAAGASTADEAVDALTTVMNAFVGQAVDVNQASDVLFATIKAGKTTMSELAASIGQVAPVAASAGVRFTDMSAAMAAVTASGLNTAETATALKATIVGILKPSESAAKAFKSIGISAKTLADSELGLEDAITKVRTAVRQNNRQLVEFFPNVRALNGVAILAGDGFKKFIDTLKQTRNATGAAESAFKKVQRTLAFQFSSVVQGAKDAFRSLGEGLAPVFVPIVAALGDATTKARKIFGAFAEFMQKRSEQIGRVVTVFVDVAKGAINGFLTAVGVDLSSAGKSFDDFLVFVEKNGGNFIRAAVEMGASIGRFVKSSMIFIDKLITAIGEMAKAAGIAGEETGTAFSSIGGVAAGIIVAFEGASAAILTAGNAASLAIFKVAEGTLKAVRFVAEGIAAAVALVAGEDAAKKFDKAAQGIADAEKLMGDAAAVSSAKLAEQVAILGKLGTRFDKLKDKIDGVADAQDKAAKATKGMTTRTKEQRKELESAAKKGPGDGGRRGRRRHQRGGGGRRGFLQLGIVRGQRGAGFPGLGGAAGQMGTVGATAGRGGGTGQFGGMVTGPGGRPGGGRPGGGQQGAMEALAQLFQRFRKLAKETADDPKIAGAFEQVKAKVKALAATIGTDAFGPAFVRLKAEIETQMAGLTTPKEFTAVAVAIQDTFEETAKKIGEANLPKKFSAIQDKFTELGDATGPEAAAKFSALADQMRKLASTAKGEAKDSFFELAREMDIAAKKAGVAGLAGELTKASAAMDSLKASAQGVAGAAGGGTFRSSSSGRRSITGRPISSGGQVESRQRGGFLSRTGPFVGHRGEFVIRRKAANAIGAAELRKLNRGVTVNNTINASDRSTLGSRAQIRAMLPELRRQTKLGVKQGGPF
jgi:TP901 family phage tail tape measure protein